jgi:NADPH2:quinone reductase
LTRVAHLQSGETVLVHGALGGLASTFPGFARNLGASTIVGTVRPTIFRSLRLRDCLMTG